jgi:hypothetical protein
MAEIKIEKKNRFGRGFGLPSSYIALYIFWYFVIAKMRTVTKTILSLIPI